ncbi:ATP-dependent DNA helicase RecG [Humisphaera borealis]|uniref:OB domain-containing protein n=1 Tax=Humisphaera borealis TaxID=2807512 RepID=A0A7M2WYC5_9BACT|nr:hypothetical protein [Humisphaera borealis]QOV89831.1 hypothetical protein IPV69_00200 [Humisphaera borealis]
MTSRFRLLVAVSVVCLSIGSAFDDGRWSAAAVAADKPPAPAPAEEIPVLAVTDVAAIKAAEGKKVTVEGTVQTAAWSKTGKVLNVTFADAGENGFLAAAFSKYKEALDAAFEGDVAKALTGKKVKVTGTVKMFKDRPEIMIEKPEQVVVVPAS